MFWNKLQKLRTFCQNTHHPAEKSGIFAVAGATVGTVAQLIPISRPAYMAIFNKSYKKCKKGLYNFSEVKYNADIR